MGYGVEVWVMELRYLGYLRYGVEVFEVFEVWGI
jgi:hypothetical protein